jgi:signal peptidase I
LLERDGNLAAIVMGGDDMAPSISPSESLKIASIEPASVRLGDVIVFRRYVPIAHRVVGRLRANGHWYFFTKGDRCPLIDSPVGEEAVLGMVEGKSAAAKKGARKTAAFAFILLWFLRTGFLRGRAMRRLNGMARMFASRGL